MEKFIEIRNNDNITQINDDYKNLSYVGKSNILKVYDNCALLEIDNKPPLHFISNTSGVAIYLIPFNLMSDWNKHLPDGYKDYCSYFLIQYSNEKNELVYAPVEDASKYVSCFYFDEDVTPVKSTMGIEIFNKKGEEIFNTNKNYLRINQINTWEEILNNDTDFSKDIECKDYDKKKLGVYFNLDPFMCKESTEKNYCDLYSVIPIIGSCNSAISGMWINYDSYYDDFDISIKDVFEFDKALFLNGQIITADVTGL